MDESYQQAQKCSVSQVLHCTLNINSLKISPKFILIVGSSLFIELSSLSWHRIFFQSFLGGIQRCWCLRLGRSQEVYLYIALGENQSVWRHSVSCVDPARIAWILKTSGVERRTVSCHRSATFVLLYRSFLVYYTHTSYIGLTMTLASPGVYKD